MENKTTKNKIRKVISGVDPNAESYLFGSRARGDHRPKSEWDILILVDQEEITNEIEDRFRDVLYDIDLELGQIISIFIYPKSYWENTLIHTPIS